MTDCSSNDHFSDYSTEERRLVLRGRSRVSTEGVAALPLTIRCGTLSFTLEVTRLSDPKETAAACAQQFSLSSKHAKKLEIVLRDMKSKHFAV
uniref:Uncharacterized protein n=1 Tax=Neobodo designis TaxID=312471 RepID=A0A7S1LEX0_NEODS